MFEKLKIEMGY